MKKLIFVLTVLFLTTTMFSCGGSAATETTTDTIAADSDTVVLDSAAVDVVDSITVAE